MFTAGAATTLLWGKHRAPLYLPGAAPIRAPAALGAVDFPASPAPTRSPPAAATTRNLDLWRLKNGQWSASVDAAAHPAGWQPAGIGDFTGDGTSDIAWHNPASGAIDLWKLVDGHWAASITVGSHPGGWTPVASGDFNGDGTSDIAWYNANWGKIDIWSLKDGHWSASTDLGSHPAGWQPLGAGDFNGDGT